MHKKRGSSDAFARLSLPSSHNSTALAHKQKWTRRTPKVETHHKWSWLESGKINRCLKLSQNWFPLPNLSTLCGFQKKYGLLTWDQKFSQVLWLSKESLLNSSKSRVRIVFENPVIRRKEGRKEGRKESGHFLCKFCTEISEAKVGAMAWRWRLVGPRSKPHFSVCLAAAACCPAFCAQGQIHAQRLQVFSYVFNKGRRIVTFIKRIQILGKKDYNPLTPFNWVKIATNCQPPFPRLGVKAGGA